MAEETSVILFGGQEVRRQWDDESERWYFSLVDVISVLTDSPNPRDYWYQLKQRLSDEEKIELSTIYRQLKLIAKDGKRYETDVADAEGTLRIIQSIPSPKAEPFKRWLAQVGYERLEEIQDPEKAIDRAMETYLRKGYSREWINQRLKSIEIRKELTGEWDQRGVKKGEYGILTDELTRAWAGLSVRDYKKHKGLKKQGLRDNMTNAELILNMLAELSTTEIARQEDAQGLRGNRMAAQRGGGVAAKARIQLEQETGAPVVSRTNNLPDTKTKKLN